MPAKRDTFNLEEIKQKPLFNYQGQPLSLSHFAEVSLGARAPWKSVVLTDCVLLRLVPITKALTLVVNNKVIMQELDKFNLPLGSQAHIGGQAEEMETSLNALMYALLLSVFLVYVVMASQFESLKQTDFNYERGTVGLGRGAYGPPSFLM